MELIKELPRQQWEANAQEKGKISKGEGDLVPNETPEASVAPKSYSAKEIRVPDLFSAVGEGRPWWSSRLLKLIKTLDSSSCFEGAFTRSHTKSNYYYR